MGENPPSTQLKQCWNLEIVVKLLGPGLGQAGKSKQLVMNSPFSSRHYAFGEKNICNVHYCSWHY